MVKGLLLISLPLTRTWSLCCPRLTAVYDTSYREGYITATGALMAGSCSVVDAGLVDHGHQPVPMGVACEGGSSSAVTYCWSEHGLPLQSVRTCVGWLAVADCRPGPLTWHVWEENLSDYCS